MTVKTTIRVWDPFIRAFHWGLVAAVAVAWLCADEWDDLHVISGYVVAGALAARLIWGFVGSHYARFEQFLPTPATILVHLRGMMAGRERRFLGHNPAARAMIVALLVALAGIAVTGWLLENDAGDTVEDLHEVLANGLLLLIALHVAGVILASVQHRETLTRAMITGDKRAPADGDIA
jgi:cytochrome b